MAIRFAFGPFRFFSSFALATGVASNVYSFKVCICQVALIRQPDKHHGIYHAIGLFAGLRSAELSRLEWREVLFDERLIEVAASKSKTAARRLVIIQPNLALWLEPYRGQYGKICPS